MAKKEHDSYVFLSDNTSERITQSQILQRDYQSLAKETLKYKGIKDISKEELYSVLQFYSISAGLETNKYCQILSDEDRERFEKNHNVIFKILLTVLKIKSNLALERGKEVAIVTYINAKNKVKRLNYYRCESEAKMFIFETSATAMSLNAIIHMKKETVPEAMEL